MSRLQQFNNYFKQRHQKNSSNKLARYLKSHQHIWILTSESVARGVAIGLFIACIPIVPFQSILTVFLAIFLRANLPLAFGVSWISNPLTILPLIYLAYCIGHWILNDPSTPIIDFHHPEQIKGYLSLGFQAFGKAFFVGLPILAFGSAIIGYIIIRLLCHFLKLDKRPQKYDQ